MITLLQSLREFAFMQERVVEEQLVLKGKGYKIGSSDDVDNKEEITIIWVDLSSCLANTLSFGQ